MKKLLILLVLLFIATTVFAQDLSFAPINPELTAYINKTLDYQKGDTPIPIIPAPLNMSSNYYDAITIDKTNFPGSYECVRTDVRNQLYDNSKNGWNGFILALPQPMSFEYTYPFFTTSWAFGIMSALESNVLTRYGVIPSNNDQRYSELNMINNSGFLKELQFKGNVLAKYGGNYNEAVAYLTRFNGPVNYDFNSFIPTLSGSGKTNMWTSPEIQNIKNTKLYVENIKYLSTKRQAPTNEYSVIDSIKYAIMNNGAVYANGIFAPYMCDPRQDDKNYSPRPDPDPDVDSLYIKYGFEDSTYFNKANSAFYFANRNPKTHSANLGTGAQNYYATENYHYVNRVVNENGYTRYGTPYIIASPFPQAFTIIGWDDSYPKEAFGHYTQEIDADGKPVVANNLPKMIWADDLPAGNGAFRVKMSLGTEFTGINMGENGYFWVSYYDTKLADYVSFDSNIDLNKYNKVYYNDFAGMVSAVNARYGRSKHTITEDATLRAIGTYCYNPGYMYKTTVYVNDVKKLELAGSFTYAGYYTIPIEPSKYLSLVKGDVVTIDVDYGNGRTPNRGNISYNDPYFLPVEYDIDGYYEGGSYRRNTSFYSIDGGNWIDTQSKPIKSSDGYYKRWNTCIRAIVGDPVKVTGVKLDKTSVSLSIGKTTSLRATVLPDNATNKSITWSSNRPGVATVDPNTGLIKAIAEGKATITVETAYDPKTETGGKTASCDVLVITPIKTITLYKEIQTGNIKEEVVANQLELTDGGTAVDLNAVFEPDNAYYKYVNWVSSNPKVATVDQNGLVTPYSTGTADVVAKAVDDTGVVSNICTVTVYSPIAIVKLNETSLSLNVGDTSSLKATVSPLSAKQGVNWKTSDASVATVDQNGLVTARGNCKLDTNGDPIPVIITVASTTVDINNLPVSKDNIYATCKVLVSTKATAISLDKSSLLLSPGKTATLTATITPSTTSNKKLAFSSSNPTIATVEAEVDGNGVQTGKAIVTAKANGAVNITAKTTDSSNKSAVCKVTVKTLADSLTLNKTQLNLLSGGYYVLKPTILPATTSNKSVTWSSNNKAVAVVDANGKVVALTSGVATITAKTADGSNLLASCSVSVSIPVSSVTLSPAKLTISVGNSSNLTATVLPANASNKKLSFTTSNVAVAIVSSTGVVTGKGNGVARITVRTIDGNKTAYCDVTVGTPVTSIKLDTNAITLPVSATRILKATIAPTTATNKAVTWKTDKAAVATVDSNGKVTAKVGGVANISVVTADGNKVATCVVTVVQPVTSVTLNKSSLTLDLTAIYTLVATINPSTATNKEVTWLTSNPNVALVNNGVITPVGAGTATITVKTTDGGKIATCKLTIVNLNSSAKTKTITKLLKR